MLKIVNLTTTTPMTSSNKNNCNRCNAPKDSEKHQECLIKSRKYFRNRRKGLQEKNHCVNCGYAFSSDEHKKCLDDKNRRDRLSIKKLKENNCCLRCECPFESIEHKKCLEEVRSKRKATVKGGYCRSHPSQQLYPNLKSCLACWFANKAGNTLGSQGKFKTSIKDLIEKQNWKCTYTGELLIPGINASLDHIIPVSKGGKNKISNIQWITLQMNNMKTNMSHNEFILMCDRISTLFAKEIHYLKQEDLKRSI